MPCNFYLLWEIANYHTCRKRKFEISRNGEIKDRDRIFTRHKNIFWAKKLIVSKYFDTFDS